MSRNTWSIYTLESGNVWTLDSSGIYVPNNVEGLSFEEVSTQVETQLVDGSKAYVTPETLYAKQPLIFNWFQVTLSFVEQIRDYQRNGESLKIVTGISGRDFIGRFTSVNPTWITGQSGLYDLDATFTLMMNLE